MTMRELLAGRVALLVNTASQCGLTPQYEGLQKLQDSLGARGFTVVAFPCNQFGGQEPGSAEDIEKLVCGRFKGTFPLMKKIDVNGDHADPLWVRLQKQPPPHAPALRRAQIPRHHRHQFLSGVYEGRKTRFSSKFTHAPTPNPPTHHK